jgi:GNAT superfamily N-acetyltransferase
MEERALITIRPAVQDDAGEIARVHVDSWRWAYEGLLPEDVLRGLSVDVRAQQWTRTIPEGHVLVAERHGEVIGFASVGPTRDADAPPHTGEVQAIYVTEAAAGRGAGRELFEAAQDLLRANGFERATLWVLEANQRGREFYERAGWSWDGARSTHQVECAHHPIVRYAAEL